jgi:6-phosphofructokinase 1
MNFAILTSGGDSPGMNSIIRAFVRYLSFNGHNVYGIESGYQGLMENRLALLAPSDVGNIIQKGGTILKTSRSLEFLKPEGRKIAVANLKRKKIQGLCVIGGDGSFKGAIALSNEHGVKVVGVPGTIDNDISGTDYTIGHETAVETATAAIDKIRDTALSHDRVFFVEVMGKSSSALCQRIAICSGAEMAILPNTKIPHEEILRLIKRGEKRGKKSSIFVVAENDVPGRCYEIQKLMSKKHGVDSHVCILGHIQRGGTPSTRDRFFGTQMGALAAQALLEKNYQYPLATVVNNDTVALTNLHDCAEKVSRTDTKILQILSMVSV